MVAERCSSYGDLRTWRTSALGSLHFGRDGFCGWGQPEESGLHGARLSSSTRPSGSA
jgi:hypothetical protein